MHGSMIRDVQPGELVILLMSGTTLVAMGLIPGLLDGLQDGLQNISALISSSFQFSRNTDQAKQVKNPVRPWLVGIGAALILAGLLNISK